MRLPSYQWRHSQMASGWGNEQFVPLNLNSIYEFFRSIIPRFEIWIVEVLPALFSPAHADQLVLSFRKMYWRERFYAPRDSGRSASIGDRYDPPDSCSPANIYFASTSMCLYIGKKIECIFSFHSEYEYAFRIIIIPTCPKICCIKRCEITVQYLNLNILHHNWVWKINRVLGFLITVV